MAIKEELDVAGCVTTYGGRANSTPAAADGEVVRRLRAAGAVIVGKTAMPEFGSYPFTESEATGYTLNPWDVARSPGGSSGGTAVAVATGMVPVGIGGDGGGSIRVPSAFCGLFGLKPQRGRVTTAPHPHLWWALGVVGPLARSVADSALVYDVIRGNLPTDRYRAGGDEPFVAAAAREPGRLRVGWSVKVPSLGVRLDPIHAARRPRHGRPARRPRTRRARDRPALPRSDAGIRAPVLRRNPHRGRRGRALRAARAPDATDLPDGRLGTSPRPGVGAAVRPRPTPPRPTGSSRGRAVDVLLSPVTAHRPPKLGIVMGKGTVRSSLASIPTVTYMVPWNVAGNPAASVPCGIGDDGLPVAVQLVGRTDDEATLLSLSAQLERARPFPRWS